jgi:hypothetical protein
VYRQRIFAFLILCFFEFGSSDGLLSLIKSEKLLEFFFTFFLGLWRKLARLEKPGRDFAALFPPRLNILVLLVLNIFFDAYFHLL